MRFLGWITENFWWKRAALTIAVLVWILVASEPELSTFVTAPLAYRNLPDDLEISSEPVNLVTLELRGPSGELRTLGDPGSSLRPVVTIDMSDVQPGVRTFPIGLRNLRLARGVRLVRAIPSEARFQFEKRLRRAVDIVPQFDAGEASAYAVSHYTVKPPQLTVIGPASRVAAIQSVKTDPMDVSQVVGTSEFRVNAFVEDPYVRFTSSPQVIVIVTMKRKS